MSQGSVSSGVRVMQVALQCAAHSPGEIDGNWGPNTTAAVRSFQRSRYGMTVDGVYGPDTHNGFPWWPSSPNQSLATYDCIGMSAGAI
ncbi:MAG: peptidoglycan-binding protein [Propionibacteriaceae bacterium]|jgi:peptidoglycan hydrolase-like protein with peptidoglycan-binding domain|nr:peptidoglycan-binding protein [Propionibacteriaceae bacterium]